MDSLDAYRARRDFKITSEPAGKKAKASKADSLRFVVQKHDATRLHYDFRLEHGGVLWSWAVTRGPSLDPSEKRLAVHVEDHPLEYGSFEGVIPKGQYGAGSVIVWDEGVWIPKGDPAAGMKKGHLDFELKGNKLNGEWHLVRLRPRPGEKKDNWLLIKAGDEHADAKRDILEEAPQSVTSGRTVEQVAAGRPGTVDTWDSGKPAAEALTRAPRPERVGGQKARCEKAEKLEFVPPCLARLESAPPAGDGWVHEVKFDGYRIQAHVAGGRVRLLTRTGLDWTTRFGKPVADALAALGVDGAIVDGEIVVIGEDGVSAFSELQLALSEGRHERMTFYAFDLLHLDGADLRVEPLIERKERLRDLLGNTVEQGPLRFSEHFSEPGRVMLQHACRMGLEGVVSKRADASYRSGRGGDWIKSKCTLRQEFVIAGYLPSDKTGRGIRSIAVAYNQKGKLHLAGQVGTGFSGKVAADLKKKLDALRAGKSPLSAKVPDERKMVWVKPDLVAEIEFRSWTRGGSIRHASFQGLREDKAAGEVVAEEADDAEQPNYSARKAGKTAARGRAVAAEAKSSAVTLTNPEKLLWPDEKVSKQDLLRHYELVWPRMKRFVVNRPLSLVRAPDGVGGHRFFQKHAMPGMHEAIRRMPDPKDGEDLLYIDDLDGLAALVQFGVVEVHIWGSTIEDVERPDQIVFDLDPDEGLDVDDVRKAALEVKEKLDELDLPNFVKVSGGKGFHAMVPLKPHADWTKVKEFAHDFAQAMAAEAPDRYTATLSKKARAGRIFIDYLRNGRGSTAVAPYSSRAKKGATVAMPVTWEMVADGAGPADYAMHAKETLALLKAADPWADFFESGKKLARG